MRDAGISASELGKVLLVGGSTRIDVYKRQMLARPSTIKKMPIQRTRVTVAPKGLMTSISPRIAVIMEMARGICQ